jgi:hypothetical protein
MFKHVLFVEIMQLQRAFLLLFCYWIKSPLQINHVIIIIIVIGLIPIEINHVGNCIRTKSPFADWSSENYKGQNKKWAPTVIMEDPELIKGGFTHPE